MDEETQAELDSLRERVGLLAAGLGVEPDFRVPESVREYALAGQTVPAVRALRRYASGRLGLMAAKRMVDELRRPTP